jgi:hypothetical protein
VQKAVKVETKKKVGRTERGPRGRRTQATSRGGLHAHRRSSRSRSSRRRRRAATVIPSLPRWAAAAGCVGGAVPDGCRGIPAAAAAGSPRAAAGMHSHLHCLAQEPSRSSSSPGSWEVRAAAAAAAAQPGSAGQPVRPAGSHGSSSLPRQRVRAPSAGAPRVPARPAAERPAQRSTHTPRSRAVAPSRGLLPTPLARPPLSPAG